MKNKRSLLWGLGLALAWNVQAQSAPSSFEVSEANPHAVRVLHELLRQYPESAPQRIFIGEKGDKVVRKFKRHLPKQAEGFYLSCTPQQWVLAGSDERGTFYAVQTLARLLAQAEAPVDTTFSDYPLIAQRGVVEGFYGNPWSHKARLRQLKFYGENKLNTYIYGPKDDPYHSSPHWREPYPEKEARQLQELVQCARENEVDFVWAIHPGKDIRWNEEDRRHLLDKFEKMYQLGVRAFAVFFDDISGEGTHPQKQAELLNAIDDLFVKVKGDVKPLIMCPTEYNKGWSNPKGHYLTTLGTVLHPSIHVMWTGDYVIADMNPEGMQWINQRIKRPAYIWWNFPVSDYVRDHLLMGPAYGNDKTIAHEMSGFVTNPMERAEASKIAIYSVGSYAWNPTRYDEWQAWQAAIENILPDAPEALACFARHNADLGVNVHGYRRNESEDIQPVAERFLSAYQADGSYQPADWKAMTETFERMQEAADVLLTSQSNRPLIEEIQPWLLQFKLVGQAGDVVMKMVQPGISEDYFLRKYQQLRSLQRQMYQNDQTYNQNPGQPGVKTATRVIKPFIDAVFAQCVAAYNQQHGTQLDAKTYYNPHQLVSDVEQLKRNPLQVRMNRVLLTPMLEVVKWPAGQQLQISFDAEYKGKQLVFNLGQKEVNRWGVLEISTDGVTWKKVDWQQQGNRCTVDLNHQPLRFLRFRNQSTAEQQVYLRQFEVTIE